MINENFFDTIDSEIKAYLLGFITADGTINDTRKTPILQVHISIKDVYIIELLENYIGCTTKTYYTSTSAAFRTTNAHLCKALEKYNIFPRKTGHEKLSDVVLNSDLSSHYIRGLIDGDGWICNTLINGTHLRKSVGFCSSEQACVQMRNYFSTRLGCYPVSVLKVKDKNNYKINYSSVDDVTKIVKFLYTNAGFYLYRKYAEAII